jgi:hypothetical protein
MVRDTLSQSAARRAILAPKCPPKATWTRQAECLANQRPVAARWTYRATVYRVLPPPPPRFSSTPGSSR